MNEGGYSDKVFCYGTLEFLEVMHAVTGRRYPHRGAVLRGHARYLLRDKVYPGIIARAGAEVRGVLYYGVGRRELRLIDCYESDFYRRSLLEVEQDCSGCARAWVYVIPSSMRGLLDDRPWDRDQFATRHLEAWLGSIGG